MSKTNKLQNQNTFVGGYVDDIVQLTAAAMVSQLHAIVISPPGWGKTDIFMAATKQMAGEGNYNVTKLTPSTSPSRINGIYNPAEYLKGNMINMVAGTASDPRNLVVIFDEVGRASEVAYDELLHIYDRKDDNPDHWPVILGTANFFPTDERTEALRDRIGLWAHVYPKISDPTPYLESFRDINHRPAINQRLPAWDEVLAVRAMTPGDKAHAAISSLIGMLMREIGQGKDPMYPNPRTLRQWYNVTFRYSAYLTGNDNFAEVPNETKRVLRYCWPMPTKDAWEAWGRKTASLADYVGAMIKAQFSHCVSEIEKLQKQAGDKSTIAYKAINVISETQKRIIAEGGTDPRVAKAKEALQAMVPDIMAGKALSAELGL